MNKITDTFINNAGKSNQKPVIEYSAHTGKRVNQCDELNVATDTVIRTLIVCAFAVGLMVIGV